MLSTREQCFVDSFELLLDLLLLLLGGPREP